MGGDLSKRFVDECPAICQAKWSPKMIAQIDLIFCQNSSQANSGGRWVQVGGGWRERERRKKTKGVCEREGGREGDT